MFEKKIYVILFILLFFYPLLAHSQNNSHTSIGTGYSIIPELIYVSSSTIQLYPYSIDYSERNLTEELSGSYGYGITIKKRLFREDIAFGVSVQSLKVLDDESLYQTFENETLSVRARVTEELSIVPLEFTGYFYLPDFTEGLKLFLGGGFGIYYGDRKRTVLNIESETISKKPGVSLIVLSGFEFSLTKNFSAVFEMKFRQAEYSVRSRYPVSEIKVSGTVYNLEQELNSKIFVDGLKLSLGISYNF